MVSTSSAATTHRGCFFRSPEPGKNGEAHASRAEVLARLFTLGADVAQQARDERAVHLLACRRLLVRAHAHLGDERRELVVDIAPLAHPPLREKLLAQVLRKLAIRLPVFDCFLQVVPDLEQREEVRLLVVKTSVRPVRRLGPLERALARIIHFEHGGDDEHLGEAVLALRRDDHARDARVDREARELPPERREGVGLIHGAELGEKLIAIGDHARRRRVEEGEALDITQPQ